MSPVKLSILISGNGSNLQAMIDATQAGVLGNASIIRVISNKKTAYGLERAAKAQIPTAYHNLVAGGYTKKYPNSDKDSKSPGSEARQAYDADLAKLVLEDHPDMVVCAGWMHIVSPAFLEPCSDAGVPIINLHPALPGEYNGIDAIKRAFADFQSQKSLPVAEKASRRARTGVMIHYVIQAVDEGKPIITEEVSIEDSDTLESLETRMHETEHRLIVQGTRMAMETLLNERGNQ